MKIKRFFLLLVAVAAMVFAVGCGNDGDTSGSAESNGMISQNSTESLSDNPVSDVPNVSHESDIGDDLSDMLSDAGDDLSDFTSDVEQGVSDLTSNVENGASDLIGDNNVGNSTAQ